MLLLGLRVYVRHMSLGIYLYITFCHVPCYSLAFVCGRLQVTQII